MKGDLKNKSPFFLFKRIQNIGIPNIFIYKRLSILLIIWVKAFLAK